MFFWPLTRYVASISISDFDTATLSNETYEYGLWGIADSPREPAFGIVVPIPVSVRALEASIVHAT